MRFTAREIGITAVVCGLIGAGLVATAYVAASARYRRARESLHRSGTTRRAGLPLALACGAALVLGAACAAYLVVGVVG